MHSIDHAVRAEGLGKRFGPNWALRQVDFEVARGRVLGLLGRNGAGKTTTVRILTTLLRPDEGRAFVDGLDVVRQAAHVRPRIGLAGQQATVDELLTGRANLEMIGRLYHLPRRVARARATQLLASFDLTDAAGKPVKSYSGGMRRRLDLAASLVASPPVLFLDEPTTGLDPHSRSDLWTMLRELVSQGTTLVLTTQYLDEADRLADDIIVVDHGRVIAEGAPDQLKAHVGGRRVVVTLDDLPHNHTHLNMSTPPAGIPTRESRRHQVADRAADRRLAPAQQRRSRRIATEFPRSRGSGDGPLDAGLVGVPASAARNTAGLSSGPRRRSSISRSTGFP